MAQPFCETIGDPELVLWRNRVLQRDNYTCQNCGLQIRKLLTPHHIKPASQFPELKYDDDNGITYCYLHHALVGHKHNKVIQDMILRRYAIILHLMYVRPTDKETVGCLYPDNIQG